MRSDNLKLFAVSFVMLFLEIFLIRWISTEVRIFAYVNNLVLLACFLGIGAGCYFSKKKVYILLTFGMLMMISLAVKSQPFQNITGMLSSFSDSVIWYEAIKTESFLSAFNGALLTLFMFSMILTAFIPLGQILGRLLDEHENIIFGYSVNVVASLIGIWAFNLFSFFYTPPWLWFAFALIILLFFLPRKEIDLLLGISISVLILLVTGIFDIPQKAIWSPYQKLSVSPNIYSGIHNGYVLNVNSVGYMTLLDLSEDFIKRYPRQYDAAMREYNQYELPHQFISSKKNVLIVGAGAGNDVAGALRSGAEEIDAVEIDPGIYTIGYELHPERPYAHDNVNVFIDDARAFFKKAKKKYDIITFGLLDSHTLSSNYNNMRLDHYVYTQESFEDAKRILKDNGAISVIFSPKRKWIAERIYGLLKKVFGDVPYVFMVSSPEGSYGWGGLMFITGKNLDLLKKNIESNQGLKDFLEKSSGQLSEGVKLTTDDWPYLYIERPGIPRMYLLIIISVIALLFIFQKILINSKSDKVDMHFFFLGCAFLLLEFQNVSKAALLFGSTWIVNSYIISSILILILLSNLFVSFFKIRKILPFYLFLLVSVSVAYLIPLNFFNTFGHNAKSFTALTILNLPIFFAGIIFIDSFKKTSSKDVALGSNLIGAAAGGILETLSFITGIKSLLIAVFLLYAASFCFLKRCHIE